MEFAIAAAVGMGVLVTGRVLATRPLVRDRTAAVRRGRNRQWAVDSGSDGADAGCGGDDGG